MLFPLSAVFFFGRKKRSASGLKNARPFAAAPPEGAARQTLRVERTPGRAAAKGPFGPPVPLRTAFRTFPARTPFFRGRHGYPLPDSGAVSDSGAVDAALSKAYISWCCRERRVGLRHASPLCSFRYQYKWSGKHVLLRVRASRAPCRPGACFCAGGEPRFPAERFSNRPRACC